MPGALSNFARKGDDVFMTQIRNTTMVDNDRCIQYTYDQTSQIANEAAEKALSMAAEQFQAWVSKYLENGIDVQTNSPVDDVLTVEELTALLKISRPTAYELIRSKDFPAFKVGKSIRINKRGLLAWIERQCAELKGAV